MICRKCHLDVPDGLYCCKCGAKQRTEHRPVKKRGNGQGTVWQLQDGKYMATAVTLFVDENGKLRKRTASRRFEKKKDALDALPALRKSLFVVAPAPVQEHVMFKDVYDKWLPTHKAGKSTIQCYKSAFKYFSDLWYYPASAITVDDLQECMDDCPQGRQTKANMKTVCGLVYKYGIPRGYFPEKLNLSDYLNVSGKGVSARASFDDEQIRKIKNRIGKTPFADYVYCLIYLGLRPAEFLDVRLENYDAKQNVIVGGAKTDAGLNRTVTISPKIQNVVKKIAGNRTEGFLFCDPADGDRFRNETFADRFYAVLEDAKIDNPIIIVGAGKNRHKYTPHSCRHTFATLIKRVAGADKDKLELIGHSSDEMLRYYQDVSIEDLKAITDAI
jgi:hypothetical protein